MEINNILYTINCSICLNIIKNSCTPSCSHHFCYNCITRWCYKKEYPKCPICKYNITEIKFDKEFDLLVNHINNIYNNNNSIISSTYLYNYSKNKINNIINNDNVNEYDDYYTIFKNNKRVYINFTSENEKISIGITVKNNKGPGIKVLNLIKNKMAINSGLAINDVILFINNIPCSDHRYFINILEKCRSTNKQVCCILEDRTY